MGECHDCVVIELLTFHKLEKNVLSCGLLCCCSFAAGSFKLNLKVGDSVSVAFSRSRKYCSFGLIHVLEWLLIVGRACRINNRVRTGIKTDVQSKAP